MPDISLPPIWFYLLVQKGQKRCYLSGTTRRRTLISLRGGHRRQLVTSVAADRPIAVTNQFPGH